MESRPDIDEPAANVIIAAEDDNDMIGSDGLFGDIMEPSDDVIKGSSDVIKGSNDVIKGSGDVIKGSGDVIKGSGDVIEGSDDVSFVAEEPMESNTVSETAVPKTIRYI